VAPFQGRPVSAPAPAGVVPPGITVRRETPADEAGVREVEERAFGRALEARLVDDLRRACPGCLSLVAVTGAGMVVGHLLFSPVTLEPDAPPAAADGPAAPDGAPLGMGLGPLAVLPERQRQGIGSALVMRGVADLSTTACPYVTVVGHPDYYPRFGFVPAAGVGLRCQWDGVPAEAWMALVLDPEGLRDTPGMVRFRREFEDAAQAEAPAPDQSAQSTPPPGRTPSP